VLACGDSCAILRRAGCATLESFPLRSAEEFNSVTLALPARTRYFDRRRQRCQRWTLSLAPGDSLILATDAVAKAILARGVRAFCTVAAARPEAAHYQGIVPAPHSESPGDGRDGLWRERHSVSGGERTRRGGEWSAIVSQWRRRGILVDDDATALVICIGEGEAALGCRPAPAAALIAARQAELAAALAEERLESVAVAYGDGSYFAEAQLAPVHAEQARLVAGALLELRMAMIGHLAARQQDATPLAAVWERWAPLLAGEPSAAALRQSLVQLGVPLAEPVWPHVAAFRTAIDRADVSAVAMLAPPEALSYLLTDSEWTLVHRARRQVRRGRRARGTAAAPGARGR